MQKFENTLWSGKCPFGEMSQWGNVHSGKCPSGKCPVGELSVRGNVRRGSVRRGSVSQGIVLGEVSVGEVSGRETVLQSTHFVKLLISLVVLNSHLFLFALIWTPVYQFIIQNLMNTFRSFCHSFNFVNMTFVVKVPFSLLISIGGLIFMENLLQNFFFYSHQECQGTSLTYNSFYRNNFISCLIKHESPSFPHCIFQSGYVFNTCSIKIQRRSVVKVLIILLIKPQFYVTY